MNQGCLTYSEDNKYLIDVEKFNFIISDTFKKNFQTKLYQYKACIMASILQLKKLTKNHFVKKCTKKCEIAKIKNIQYKILNKCVRQ